MLGMPIHVSRTLQVSSDLDIQLSIAEQPRVSVLPDSSMGSDRVLPDKVLRPPLI